MTSRVGFIGAGQMACALARGFVSAGHVAEASVFACDPAASAREEFLRVLPQSQVGDVVTELVAGCDCIFLAVKPQHVESVFRQLSGTNRGDVLFVSIVAGVTLARLSAGLGTQRIIRVMPNTPCLVMQGAAGFCAGDGASNDDVEAVIALLSAVGMAFLLPESSLDAVTGLSGSGPAFVFQIIEALSDGGVRVGLSRDVATQLAAQTVAGAARMVLETSEHPGVLKDRVASPGGTTIAGLHALESGRLRATLIDAVVQATNRSKELGQA